MTAQTFIDIATTVLAKFAHKDDCFEAPEIVSHPTTGQIGMACKACKRLVVITKVDKAPVVEKEKTDDDGNPHLPTPRSRPRFKL